MLDKETATKLLNVGRQVKPDTFYMLRKSQKTDFPTKGRPIVVNIQTITEELSNYLDKLFKTVDITIQSYVKNTSEFLKKLISVYNLISESTRRVTLDVTPLYTSIPNEEGVAEFPRYELISKLKETSLCYMNQIKNKNKIDTLTDLFNKKIIRPYLNMHPNSYCGRNVNRISKKAIQDLSINQDIVVCKADKGSKIVIWSKAYYQVESQRHLNLDAYTEISDVQY
ncbi:hypothetical protein GJ496_000365 [Pomphorhynchus laevis]|nr:hypothetical protein GJ496_000365 [Pomphorhynchus laevis]